MNTRSDPPNRSLPSRLALVSRSRVRTLAFTPILVVASTWILAPTAALADNTARDLQRAGTYCQAGAKALENGDLEKARSSYTRALALSSVYPDAHLGLGHVLMKESRFEEALKEYLTARDGFAQLGEAIYDLRVQHYRDAQHQINVLRDVLRNYQTLPGASTDPTTAARRMNETDEEIRKLEAVEAPLPGKGSEPPGEVFFHIGNAQFRLGRLDDALASWETCAQKSPKFALVRINLTVLYWKKGRFDEARKSLARAEELGYPVKPQMKVDLEKAASAAGGGAPK